MPRFHLIPNAHLDPVWLWDWREGLNEGITTCRAVLNLMDEFPELTFARGEASIYEHVERHDPETFARIRAQIASGRWDVVGGNYVQPDTNLPATEVLVRQFRRGLGYFKNVLGVRPTVAWAPDSFGHSAGWPEIYAAAGMKSFAFSRPFASDLALPGPAFWWEAASGSRVLAWRMPVGWYGSTRKEVPERLDRHRAEAPQWGVENIPVFFGLGNHGGGPSRAQIEAILRWRDQHADVTVEFSTLHRFFAALGSESANLPVFRGEQNFALRGCYASAAAFKFPYRRTENLLLRAERTSSAIAAATQTPAPDLREAWDAVLFNCFHDILPGSSIERAFVDQKAWIGLAWHHAHRVELTALNQLAANIDTRVPATVGDRPTVVPVLLWNSCAEPFDGPVEFEVPLDYRPLDEFRGKPDDVPLAVCDANGRVLPFQSVATENEFATDVPWRKRLVVRTRIPALGWHVITVGWAQDAKKNASPVSDLRTKSGVVSNRYWRIETRKSRRGITVTRGKTEPFTLRVLTIDDPWGSWGGHDGEEKSNHVNDVKAVWKVAAVQILERGPERAALWVRLAAGASWLELTFQLFRDDPTVIVRSRVFWADNAARLKLQFSVGSEAEFEVPGGTVRRQPCGEVPGGRWVRVGIGERAFVFASDALYNFDLGLVAFGATVLRSCRYAAMNRSTPAEQPSRPYMDLGEHVFQFALAVGDADAGALSRRLESPPIAAIVPARAGTWPRSGGMLRLSAGLELLAFAPATAKGGWFLRVQNTTARRLVGSVVFLGAKLALGSITKYRIHTVLLQQDGQTWKTTVVNAVEERVGTEAKS